MMDPTSEKSLSAQQSRAITVTMCGLFLASVSLGVMAGLPAVVLLWGLTITALGVADYASGQ